MTKQRRAGLGALAWRISGDGRGGSAAEGRGGGTLVAMATAEAWHGTLVLMAMASRGAVVVRPSGGTHGWCRGARHSTLVVMAAVVVHWWR